MDKKRLENLRKQLVKYGKLSKKTKLMINIRKNIHPILLNIMSLKRKEDLFSEGGIDTEQTYLIIANHSCIDDIPALAETVKEHFYLLVSDEDRYTLNGIALDVNGVYWIKRTDKDSRRCSSEVISIYLDNKNSFAMYPEATWNLSPNYLMLPMNYGYIKIANQTKICVPIKPVVTFFSQNKRYSIIGDTVYPTRNIEEVNDSIRDQMSSILYKEMEMYYQENEDKTHIHKMIIDGEVYYYEKREELDPYYWDKYIHNLYSQYSRAKKDPDGVREYESQFIIEPPTDAYEFFIIFNSSIRYDPNGNILIKRITSEKNGYRGTTSDDIDYGKFFGYGYNEVKYKKQLIKK